MVHEKGRRFGNTDVEGTDLTGMEGGFVRDGDDTEVVG